MRLKYAFINQLSADYSVRRLCLTLKVHASGYYAWLAEPKSARAKDDQRLLGLIKHAWLESGRVYGYRKIHDDLRELGEACGKHRVARLMRLEGLRLIMETWTGAFPQLLAAYEHKERFYGIWDATTRLQAEAALDEWIATIPKGQKEVWSDLVRAVGNWREETMTYFETDMPVTNAYTESINRLAKDKNREGRGYSFEVMRARMLYTTKHKKKAPTAKVSPFYKKTIGYGLPDFAEELNYGVDLSTI